MHSCKLYIILTIISAAQNEAALTYHIVRRLYFLAPIFAATIIIISMLGPHHIPANIFINIVHKNLCYLITLQH